MHVPPQIIIWVTWSLSTTSLMQKNLSYPCLSFILCEHRPNKTTQNTVFISKQEAYQTMGCCWHLCTWFCGHIMIHELQSITRTRHMPKLKDPLELQIFLVWWINQILSVGRFNFNFQYQSNNKSWPNFMIQGSLFLVEQKIGNWV